MDEVEVEVLCAELPKGFVKGRLDVLWCMERIPELGSEPDLVAGDTTVLDSLADLFLVLRNSTNVHEHYITRAGRTR